MDIARPELKTQKRRRQLFILAAVILGVAAVAVGRSRLKPPAPTVERGTVWTDTVKRGPMLRTELAESDIDLVNRQISRKAVTNALLPSLSLVGFYGGSGLAGPLNPAYNPALTGVPNTSSVPTNFAGALGN